MSNNALRNAAYSEKYKEENSRYAALFSEENRTDSEDIFLPNLYKITKITYKGEVESCNLSGSRCTLATDTGEIIHSWKSFDCNADFHTLIIHKNGCEYLIYRQDLYGYSIFDLTNSKEFQYYPQCVLDGCEYFIWTEVHYNPQNNLLAVTGCIWGAPWSTLLVDFTNPMEEPKFQIDIIDCLDGTYDVYDDADFVRWDEQNLVLSCYNVKLSAKEEVIVSPETYY